MKFLCDAMLGGLARWLRALGYEATFEEGIDDGVLVELAASTGSTILSSDQPLFDRKRIKSGEVRALFVPRHAPIVDQAVFVLKELGLSLRALRCMSCGASLESVALEEVESHVPPASREAFHEFWRCTGCRGVYWKGTHWTRIEATRADVARRLGA